jgi:kynurenine formamidase
LKADFGGIVCNDDHVLLATQGSSQWDSFVHSGMVEDGVDGVFYNGFTLDDVDDSGYAKRGGIDKVAQRGIVGRGVLVDVARMVADGDSVALPLDFVIDESVYRSCLDHQGVRIEPGDIVCIRTGWTEAYLAADDERRAHMMAHDTPSPGISPALAPVIHAERWAAVTADNLAVEANPILPSYLESAHVRVLRNLGVPFGELLLFADLSAACAADRRWAFQFVAVPLWIPGGMGSPANAIAIR